MIPANEVSAVLVTRGDVDLTPILLTLQWCDDVIVWDNSRREDLGIYGRYAAIAEAKHKVVYTQDDDVVVTCHKKLLKAYEPGVLTVNYPEPWDIPWVARGGVFDRDLPGRAFEVYLSKWEYDGLFTHGICDAVFGLLSETNVVDYGSRDLPHANADGRVSTTAGWYNERRPLAALRCDMLKVAA